MKKISMQFILRIIAIIVFIGGAFIGYDVGDKMVTINHVISYQFSVIDALIVWFMSFAIGAVSYPHLDVYKRQHFHTARPKGAAV